ncbi:DUF3592 domain-containing protein [Marinobacter sp. 1Y8]
MAVTVTGPGATGSDSKKSSLWVTLFGGIFLLVGLGVMVFGPLESFYRHLTTANWQQVPATLEMIDLRSHHGDDSTTYSVEARYRYRYNGQDYAGDRVNYDSGSDNISDYQQNLVRRVRQADSRHSLQVWIDPDAPAESYLVRELRWKKMLFMMLFGTVFAGAGVGIIFLFRLRNKEKAKGQEVIYSSERHGHWVLWFMSFMFIAISLPAVMAVPEELGKENWLILVVLLFPLAGVVMGRMGWVMRRNWRYYGPLPLVLQPLQGQVGGDIAGVITLNKLTADTGDAAWINTLQCVRVRISKGKNSSRSESIIWQADQAPYLAPEGEGARLQFCFQPPADLPATDGEGRDQVIWRLILEGPATPVKLERTYEIPAVKGSLKSGIELPEAHIERHERMARVQAASSVAEQIDVEPLGDGMRIYSRIGRNAGMTFGLVLFGLVFGGASVWLWIAAASEGFMLYVMAIGFGLFGFPMFIGGLFVAGRALDARVTSQQVNITRYWCGLGLWRRTGQLERADQLVLESGGKMTQGHKMTEYVHLEVKNGGKQVRIAESIAGREAGEILRDNLVRMLRLP